MIYDVHDAVEALDGSTEARALVLTQSIDYLDRLSADAVDEGGPSCRTFRIVRLGDVDVVCHEDAATELSGEVHRLPVSGDGLLAVGCVDVCQIAGRVAVPQMDVDGVEMELQFPERLTQVRTEAGIVVGEIGMIIA